MLNRRVILAFLMLCLAHSLPVRAEPAQMSAKIAYEKSAAGQIILIDIRSPGEWRDTGIATSATPVSMHQPEFMEKLAKATGGNKSKPIAVICASGGRSTAVAPKLEEAGYTKVFNVAEGMLGGRHGQGWIPAGLPVKPYGAEQ